MHFLTLEASTLQVDTKDFKYMGKIYVIMIQKYILKKKLHML